MEHKIDQISQQLSAQNARLTKLEHQLNTNSAQFNRLEILIKQHSDGINRRISHVINTLGDRFSSVHNRLDRQEAAFEYIEERLKWSDGPEGDMALVG